MSYSNANFGGKIGTDTTYVKQFNLGSPVTLWKTFYYNSGGVPIPVLSPASETFKSLYIPGDLFVDGSIINPSDKHLKNNIDEIDVETTNKIMNLKASKFTFKKDPKGHIHYGFIAQELENEYPELISVKPDTNMSNLKSINYLELIPLLVNKIQMMQKEIDDLKLEIKK